MLFILFMPAAFVLLVQERQAFLLLIQELQANHFFIAYPKKWWRDPTHKGQFQLIRFNLMPLFVDIHLTVNTVTLFMPAAFVLLIQE
jgi:hypothetical protein